jgi:hypothetical protein
MQLTLAASAPPSDSSVREDIQKTRMLLEGEEGSPNCFFAGLMSTFAEHHGPRHHHDFDQVRYPVEGEFVYAEGKVLPEGWVGYFPEGTYYGPQIRRPGLLLFYSEFGGASGRGHLTRRQRKAARDELKRKGTVAKGMFTYTDDEGIAHAMDAHEAMGEVARGVKLPYPEPRYEGVITMNPASFSWVSDQDSPGVSHKWLGTFTERETRVGFIGIEAGATLKAGLHSAPELLFITKGSVLCQEQACPRHSAFAFDSFEGPVRISAIEPTEILRIQLPTFLA